MARDAQTSRSEPLPEPRDVDYPAGPLRLEVDASDSRRGIVQVRQTIPLAGPGPVILLYPEWMPGYHAPRNPIELLAGLEVRVGEQLLDWRRDPVAVHAFHVEAPPGAQALDIRFQFLTPTTSGQGDVVVTPEIALLQWGRLLLYPAGYFSRRIPVQAELTLPAGWSLGTPLEVARTEGARTVFEVTPLDVLVDSPVMAGAHMKEVALDEGGEVRLLLFAHSPGHLDGRDQALVEAHRRLVAQADRLFGARHFDRYRFLVALSDEIGGGGVEHHRCAEIIVPPRYLSDWDRYLTKRDVSAHEYVHSWNGKFRRDADSWTPTFDKPIGNDMMWVYEGQTQFWGHVLTARSGMWSLEDALGALAKVAATYDQRPGGRWRTLADTTRDPIISGRKPLPWPSWQRSEDYYSEGLLVWLEVDTLIRERSGETRSLDDFARAFFGVEDGRMRTLTYDYEEVIAALNAVAPFAWRDLLDRRLLARTQGAPLEGLERGGYRLVFRPERNDFCRRFDADVGQFDLRFSIGANIGQDGTVQEVVWESPAFEAGLTAGVLIQAVNGQAYNEQVIGDAIEAGEIAVEFLRRGRLENARIAWTGGHRFPHLEPVPGARRRLDEILRPLEEVREPSAGVACSASTA